MDNTMMNQKTKKKTLREQEKTRRKQAEDRRKTNRKHRKTDGKLFDNNGSHTDNRHPSVTPRHSQLTLRTYFAKFGTCDTLPSLPSIFGHSSLGVFCKTTNVQKVFKK